jgi:hypothetical protein
MPCKFVFKLVDGGEYMVMFKHGDDLRQDNLILQIIMLMNKVMVFILQIIMLMNKVNGVYPTDNYVNEQGKWCSSYR